MDGFVLGQAATTERFSDISRAVPTSDQEVGKYMQAHIVSQGKPQGLRFFGRKERGPQNDKRNVVSTPRDARLGDNEEETRGRACGGMIAGGC